jgi:hypothetical protein
MSVVFSNAARIRRLVMSAGATLPVLCEPDEPLGVSGAEIHVDPS